MSSFSPFFDVFGKEILSKKSDGNMRRNPDVESQISDPKMSKSFTLNGLKHSIEDVLVRVLTIGAFLHLLKLSFGIIEGKTAERRGKS